MPPNREHGSARAHEATQAVRERQMISIPGSVAEVGSFRGGSAHFIASAFLRATGEEVPFHVFDTFEGHPPEAITEHDTFQKGGKFAETSYEAVREYLARFERIHIHKGDVLALLPTLSESFYRFVHIDTDLYQPTLACLNYFGQRVSIGGIIVVDDYGSGKCAGVPKAVAEYLERGEAFQVWDMRSEQLMLIKR